MTQKEALALLEPTIPNYMRFTGYTNDDRVKEKLTKLFGSPTAKPSMIDFIKALRQDLSNTASGRVKPEGDLDRNQQAARKDAAHAEKLEMENDLRRGELVEAEEVRINWVQICSNVRASLMSLPSRMAKELSSMDEPREIQILLSSEVRSTLESLSE